MNVEERLALVRQVGEEIVTEEELRLLLESKSHPVAYDGFEPSGTIHIAQGILRAINVNKMAKAGARFKMFVADWHAWANNKMGGDLEKIQTTGRYIQEIWKVTGMDLQHVDFVWASEFVTDEEYWKKVMNVARDSSLDRVLRTTQIMGRSDKDKLSAAQILYPCMQAADIFHLKADITQLGMDQRKVNMLAREVGPKLGFWKPVVVSHHMLMGLQQPPVTFSLNNELHKLVLAHLGGISITRQLAGGEPMNEPSVSQILGEYEMDMKTATSLDSARDRTNRLYEQAQAESNRLRAMPPSERGPAMDMWSRVTSGALQVRDVLEDLPKRMQEATVERATAMKMSKSNPDSAIFMTDSAADVERKLKNAYCPAKVATENPVLEYLRYLVFERFPDVTIERPEKFGGNVVYQSYADLERDFAEGKLHPMDAKKATAKHVNELLEPVRQHFERDEKARKLKEQVESFKVTR